MEYNSYLYFFRNFIVINSLLSKFLPTLSVYMVLDIPDFLLLAYLDPFYRDRDMVSGGGCELL